MKNSKITSIILISLLSFTLISCGSNNENKNTQTTESQNLEDTTNIEPEENSEFKEIISLKDISKKSVAEVNNLLGAPEKTEESSNYITNYYMNGVVEVAFKNDVAARITVTPDSSIPFFNDSKKQVKTLKSLGINEDEVKHVPSADNLYVNTWSNICDVYEISVFNNQAKNDGNDTISYLYVITDKDFK